jgi:hypothetical protein
MTHSEEEKEAINRQYGKLAYLAKPFPKSLSETLYTAWAQSEIVKILWPALEFQPWDIISTEHKQYWITNINKIIDDYNLGNPQYTEAHQWMASYKRQKGV